MKKEVYKLILVFIMITFSFSLAFFLGREISISSEKNTKQSLSKDKTIEQTDKPLINSSSDAVVPTKTIQREKIQQYKETPSSTKETLPTKEDMKVTQKSKVQETTKKPEKIYGLLIGNYDDKESAMEQSTQLKIRFPQWKVFFKQSKNSFKVYIGPFKKEEAAKIFLNELKQKPEFSSIKLEKI